MLLPLAPHVAIAPVPFVPLAPAGPVAPVLAASVK
jgi:hypothetical protein